MLLRAMLQRIDIILSENLQVMELEKHFMNTPIFIIMENLDNEPNSKKE
jgi:hypothetical protein